MLGEGNTKENKTVWAPGFMQLTLQGELQFNCVVTGYVTTVQLHLHVELMLGFSGTGLLYYDTIFRDHLSGNITSFQREVKKLFKQARVRQYYMGLFDSKMSHKMSKTLKISSCICDIHTAVHPEAIVKWT